MQTDITKIQILTAQRDGHPLFYCHAEDRDHAPFLVVERGKRGIYIKCFSQLYKVKANPQSKNRVDIYMAVAAAKALGAALIEAADGDAEEWKVPGVDPGANASGRMKLPEIVWTRSGRFIHAAVRIRSGTRMHREGGTMYVELERPDESHIKMKEPEIHVGLALSRPEGNHDTAEPIPVYVPAEELQRGTGEQNPVPKVRGDFYLILAPAVAGGLGLLLLGMDG